MTTTDPSHNANNDQPVYPEIPLEFAHTLEKSQPEKIEIGPEIPEYPKPVLLIQLAGRKDGTAAANLAIIDVRGFNSTDDFSIVNLDSGEVSRIPLHESNDWLTLGRTSPTPEIAQKFGLDQQSTVSSKHIQFSIRKGGDKTVIYVNDPGSLNGTDVSRDPELIIAAMENANMPTADKIAKDMRAELESENAQKDVVVVEPESESDPEPLTPEVGDTVDRSILVQPAESEPESFEYRKPVKTRPEWIKTAEEKIGWMLNSPGNTSMARDFLRTLGATPEEIRAKLDPNTGDAEARAGLQLIIRRAIDELGDQNELPERVQTNHIDPYGQGGRADDFGFSPDSKQKYEPRDYAAMLAVAMLDGRFNTERSDREEKSSGAGHHRTAAKMALKRIGVDEKYANVSDDADKEVTAEHESLRELHHALTKYINDNGMTEEAKGIMRVANDLKAIISPDMIDKAALHDRASFFVNKLEQLNARLHELRTVANGVKQKRDLGQSSKSEQRDFEDVERELQTLTSRSEGISHQDYLVRELSKLRQIDDAMHVLQIKGMIRRGQLDEIIGAVRDIGNELEALATRGQ